MSVKSTKNTHQFDALTVLRAASAAAMTSDTNTDAIALDYQAAYWNTGDLAQDHIVNVVVEVTAYANGPVTVSVETAISGDASFGGTVTTVGSVSVAATGRYVIPVLRSVLEKTASTRYMRVKFDVPASGSPSITATVYLSPLMD